MASAENQEMVQTLPPDRSDESFRIGVLPRTLWSGEHLMDIQCLQTPADLEAIDSIPITDQIPRCRAVSKRLRDLLSNPSRGGVVGHVKVQDLPAAVFQDEEDKQDLQPYRGHRKEVHRYDFTQVVLQKRLPGLRR